MSGYLCGAKLISPTIRYKKLNKMVISNSITKLLYYIDAYISCISIIYTVCPMEVVANVCHVVLNIVVEVQ